MQYFDKFINIIYKKYFNKLMIMLFLINIVLPITKLIIKLSIIIKQKQNKLSKTKNLNKHIS